MGLKGIFKDNKEFDSTLSVVFVFICFLVVLGAVVSSVLRDLPVSPELINIFQAVKELVQLILVYHFTKSVPPALERLTDKDK